MTKRRAYSFLTGFIILFTVYHFPEFFSAFWIMAVFKVGFLFTAFLLAYLQGWKGLGGYGLSMQPYWGYRLVKGLCIGITGFGISVLSSTLLGYEEITSLPSFKILITQLPVILLITSIPSLAEDILTRGYLLGHLGNRMNKMTWILVSASVFVLNHIWRLDDGAAVLAYLFSLGLLLAYTVWKTKSLWLAFGIHWGSNLTFESVNSFLKTESLVTHNGSTWLLAAVWGILFIIFIMLQPDKDLSKTGN